MLGSELDAGDLGDVFARIDAPVALVTDPPYDDPLALAMLIDIFSERGYQALVDVNRIEVPRRIDPETHEIACDQKRVYRFQVMFAASAIRRGHD